MHFLPVAILGIIGLTVCLLTGLTLFFKTRHRERLALIKYDKDASIFKKEKSPGKSTLKWALLFMGAGAGIFVGTLIDSIFGSEPGGTFAALFFFGGGALFIYYTQMARQSQSVRDEDEYI